VASTALPGSRRARLIATTSAPAARVFASARPQHQHLPPHRTSTRSRRSVATLSDLSTKSAATIALPSCIYHSLADSHAAAIKRVLHTQYDASLLQRISPAANALYWGPATAADFGALLSHAVSNTRVTVFPAIDRNPELRPDIRGISQIKKQHRLVYKNGTCGCASTSDCWGNLAFSFKAHERKKFIIRLPKTLWNSLKQQ